MAKVHGVWHQRGHNSESIVLALARAYWACPKSQIVRPSQYGTRLSLPSPGHSQSNRREDVGSVFKAFLGRSGGCPVKSLPMPRISTQPLRSG